MLALSVKIPTM